MAERVLVIEDEALVRDLVVLNLKHAGYEVRSEGTFAGGLAALTAPGIDLAIVDVMMPGGEGFALVRQARDEGVKCPIMMLTARAEVSSRVRGLDCGADDYLTKPFDVAELMARVRSLFRRSSGSVAATPRQLQLGQFWVRFDTGRAMTNEGEVTLSDKELKLMELFARQEDRVLSRADMLEEVWGMDAFPTDRTVDNFVMRLRRLFEVNPEQPAHIVTVRGRGYLFRRSPVA
jgi:two-component system, OmpR family, alkaline phosphatase synthesis response regulator PhoP